MRRAANQRFLGAMLDMGILQDHAELALAETGNVGVEVRPWPVPSTSSRRHAGKMQATAGERAQAVGGHARRLASARLTGHSA